MAFDKLADGIIRHAKLIIAIWVVILLISAPLALKSQEVMNYDVNDMAGEDSESVQGMVILSQYFPSSEVDISSIPVLVLHFSDAAGEQSAQDFIEYLDSHMDGYVDEDGNRKVLTVSSVGSQYGDSADGSGIVLAGIVYTDAVTDITADTPFLRDFIKEQQAEFGSDGEFTAYLSGTPAIGYDTEHGATADIQRIDPFTILLILVLVGLFFRSFITSATPPMTIGVAFVVVLALIFGLGQVMNIFFITEMMLLVSMMGAGCDYCIFIIARYREELRSGKEHTEALREAIKWAGESIAISGASVIIGFGAMSICSFSMVSTMGICLALGIIVALLAALTFIPSVLALVGDRIFWPSKMDSFREGGKSTRGWYAWCGKVGHSYFERSSRFSIKHAKAILAVTILVSVPAAYVALESETSYDMISSMQNGDSGAGMDLIGEYADQGMMMPNYSIIEFAEPIADITLPSIDADGQPTAGSLVWRDSWKNDIYGKLEAMYLDTIARDGGDDSNIAYIYGPYMWDAAVRKAYESGISDPDQIIAAAVGSANGITAQYVAAAVTEMVKAVAETTGDDLAAKQYVIANGAPTIDYVANCTGALIGGEYATDSAQPGQTSTASIIKITAATHDAAMAPRSMESIDALSAAVENFVSANSGLIAGTWVTGTAAVMYEVSKVISDEFNKIEILVIVLIIILLFVVMRSYTIPFRSVATILMSICWTLAATHLLFTNLLGGEVMWLIPLILLVICLGLGMDYDILLTTRIRENVLDKGMSNDEAIHQAVVHSGSVITICGLIMGGAFGTLMLSNMVMMQQFGFALCFAIIADALIVRTYIVPAVMHLLGDWNWKCPGFMMPKALKNRQDD